MFRRVLLSGQYVLGPEVERFERELASYLGVRHAVGVSSGTGALLVSLMALGVGPGDEVIVSPFVFFSAAGSIARLGAKPVFVDIHPRSYNLDPDHLEAAITDKTRAILAAHLFGLPCQVDRITRIAAAHDIPVVEDAHQAFGAEWDGKKVGTFGKAGAFDFFPNKVLPTIGNAGALVTDDDAVARRARSLRVHGLNPDREYTYDSIGGNFRIDVLHAAMLSLKLPHVDEWIERRRAIAERYHRYFEPLPLTVPLEDRRRKHVYNHYTIRVRGNGREPLRHHLRAMGVGHKVYYPQPLHLEPAFAYLNIPNGSLPAAERASQELLTLPIYPEMTRDEQDRVIGAVRDYFNAE